MSVLHVVTPTGGRPLAFGLCARWMRRQTYAGPVRWIVVDDCDPPTAPPVMPPHWHVMVIAVAPRWQPGQRTQPRNLVAGLDACEPGAPVVIVEDDDWYAPDYLAETAARVQTHALVGSGPQRWHHPAARVHGEFAALWPWTSQLAAAPTAVPHLRAIAASREIYIDRDAWQQWRGSKRYDRDGRVIGIKGLPGRAGYMPQHRKPLGQHDPDLRQLARWIGDDVHHYLAALASMEAVPC